MNRICIVPNVDGTGGMASFRRKFEAGLTRRGVEVTHDLNIPAEALLVIAGTRSLVPLWRRRRDGVRIVQRLDGINWVQRRKNTGVRHFLRAEYGNLLLSTIRTRIASRIVYQSDFSRAWWESWYGNTPVPCSVVHNGVDLQQYAPAKDARVPGQRRRILVVEGSLGGGYDMGLDNAVDLAQTLAEQHGLPVELMVAGKISEAHRRAVEEKARVPILWAGVLAAEGVIEAMRSADVLFSADLHPACPNSVIEALACGLPVAAFDTGALKELVPPAAGMIVSYGGDPWKIDPPDIKGLARATAELLQDATRYRNGARRQAEQQLGLDAMVTGYLKALTEG